MTRLRQAWPEACTIVRGDSGFCSQPLLPWCERHGVGYIIGVARNARQHGHVEAWEAELESAFASQGKAPRSIHEFRYAAASWKVERRVITRLEFASQGTNPRFVVTSLDRPAADLYDQLYCQRSEAENRIKEAQLDPFGARASSHKFHANWLRLMFAALAYALMQRLRKIALASTDLAKATAASIGVQLFKIGAPAVRNTRRVRILLALHHPQREAFLSAARALAR